ncbi:glycosyltransferase family 2 protein [Pedobacter ginsengisoli]|uniref:glycosyltransferase family 2 protein n=1 Tax=Pedobacter ginsengisoli TaxID=363852 RepID=UPI002549C309|nr:glycosyltransferase family 2 protein [Pedobacter ginsengisoli]
MLPILSISVVLYHNDPQELKELVANILNSSIRIKLYLVDNSSTDQLNMKHQGGDVEYIHNGKNIGYGAGHNIAIRLSLESGFKYHLVMNPDISFGPLTLEKIYAFMEEHPEVGQLMPRILYVDGTIQPLCKLLPTPFDLIGRRFFKNAEWAKRRNQKYELEGFNYDKIINTPSLSGCFMFLRNDVLKKSGLFDQRYFMYLEDYDLTRRIHQHSETIFYPGAEVLHGYKKESYVNKTLLKYHIASAIKYFNKWGWILDTERTHLNRRTSKQIQ